ncbi:MAG: hypothetical protein O3A92_17170, partial [Verrucomicrobia bacterium]|nr:hypothetical protein [Verrucomicrobiota bacterium]
MSEGEEKVKGMSGVKIALVALPLCLVLSTAGAVWYHWHKETEEVADPGLAMMGEGIDRAEVEDSLKKLEWLGDANWETEEGRKKMGGVLSFVEGTLSPQNYGFVVQKGAEVSYEGELWPMVWVDVEGGEKKDEVVVVAAAYDGDEGSLVALMTAARELRNLEGSRTIRFLMYQGALAREGVVRDRSFMKNGEELVRVLELKGMGGDGPVTLEVTGAEVAGLEGAFGHPDTERRTGSRASEAMDRIFGLGGRDVLLDFGPEYAEKWARMRQVDQRLLIARTRVLVEVLR